MEHHCRRGRGRESCFQNASGRRIVKVFAGCGRLRRTTTTRAAPSSGRGVVPDRRWERDRPRGIPRSCRPGPGPGELGRGEAQLGGPRGAIMGHLRVLEAAVIGVVHPEWQERPLSCGPQARRGGPTKEILEFAQDNVAKWRLPDDAAFSRRSRRRASAGFSKKKLHAPSRGLQAADRVGRRHLWKALGKPTRGSLRW